MRRFRLIGTIAILLAAAQAASASDAPLPVCSFSSLNLGVVSATVVDAIRSQAQTLTPVAGRKIVIVHLQAGNQIPKDCEWISDVLDMEAVYQVPAGPKGLPYEIVPATAVKIMALQGGGAL